MFVLNYLIIKKYVGKTIFQTNNIKQTRKEVCPTLDNYGQSCFVRSDFLVRHK
jgi:hypothetical protein